MEEYRISMEEGDRMHIQMRNDFTRIFFFCVLVVFFCGCTGNVVSDGQMESEESQGFSASEWLPDGYGWSTHFEMAGKMAGDRNRLYRAGSGGDEFQLVGNTLYYKVRGTWDMVQGRQETALYIQKQGEEARLFLQFGKDDQKYLSHFAVGDDGCLYVVYTERNAEGAGASTILTKWDSEFQEQYSLDITKIVSGGVYDLKVRADGGVYGITADGAVFFWNEKGEYQGSFSLDLDIKRQGSLIDAGEAGVYVCYLPQDEEGSTKEMRLYNLDVWQEMEERERATAQPLAVDLESQPVAARNYNPLLVFGDGSGVYLADKNCLWKIDLTDGSLDMVFNWEEVSLRAESIRQMARQEDGSFLFFVLDTLGMQSCWCSVKAVPASELPEKVELVLGVAGLSYGGYSLTFYLDEVVMAYNMMHPKAPVTIRRYGDDSLTEFQLELLNGEGPDILLEPSRQFDMENLLRKDAVADLAPYLEKAEEVTREDIVPGILEAITKEGQIARIPLTFSVDVLIVPKENAKENMTPQEMVSLASKDARYRDIYSLGVWEILAGGEIERYVEEEGKSCTFDSEEFIGLLEDLRAMYEVERVRDRELSAELFREGQLPVILGELERTRDYLYMRNDFADCGRIVGYPNSDRELRYPLHLYDWLGINNASAHKEEAWGFIEFCMLYGSSTANTIYDNFRVMQDTFEEQTYFEDDENTGLLLGGASPFSGRGLNRENLVFTTKEETKWLREITEHLYFYENDDLKNIIMEESGAFFAGDISAQEAAKRIQNRAMLVLGE